MSLDSKKLKQIREPFERYVYEVLMKLDMKVEYFNVEVYYHKQYLSSGFETDFEIHFRNNSKEYLFVIECKHRKTASEINVNELEKFAKNINKIKEIYNDSEFIVKPIFLIWIEDNTDIPNSLSNVAQTHDIRIYNRSLIEHLSDAIDNLSPSIAFLEFLYTYFNIQISFEKSDLSFRCIKNNNFEYPTYTFSISANDLIRISYVNRANIDKPDLAKAYQRAIKVKRLDEIARFISEQNKNSKIEIFPNNIIISMKDFNFIQDENNPNWGTIQLPNKYGVLWVIDGQHRLYSFCKIKNENIRNNYQFIVTAYPNISESEQAEIFYMINDKQEGINSDLIMYILAQLLESSKGYAAKVLIDIDKEGIFTNKIKKGLENEKRGSWLRLSTLVNALTEERLIDYEKESGGLLQMSREDLENPLRILRIYLKCIKSHFKTSWEKKKYGFAQSNQGLAILFIILRKILELKIKSKKDDLKDICEDTFMDFFRKINSNYLDYKLLTGKELGDIRNKSDRRAVAEKLWDKIK